MTAALAGLRALDLSTTLAGAHVGQLLADFGAEVVGVEPPGGSPLRREAAWPFWARGKQSLVLDLANAADRRVAEGLALEADVLVETWRPGVADKLGLGFEALSAANPRLVYASITGFGRNGPLARLQGYEGVVMAKLGAFGAQAHLTARPGPSFIAAPFCSWSAAQQALHGILASLFERERSGRGQRVDATLVQGLLAHDTWNWLIRFVAHKYTGAYRTARPVSERGVPNHPLMFRLLVGLTKDGCYLQFSQSSDHLFEAFLRAAGLDWMLSDPHWSKAGGHEDEAVREAYWEKLLGAVREKTLAEWTQIFDGNSDVWAERFRRGTELLDHPQLRHDGHVVELSDQGRGAVLQPGPLVHMDATPATGLRPAPALDADGEALRARAARARPQAAAPVAGPEGAPLAGVTVLELGTWFAAPYGATLLADLGARVIKLEQLDGDPIRKVIPFPEVAGVKVLMGKESVALDVASDAGREIVHALARRAQLVLRSFRAGVAERLGLDAKSLLAVNPDLVYLDAPGYGVDGPCGHRPAFAPTIAAASGLSTRIAGPLVPEGAELSLAEVKAGAMRLFGAGAFIAQSDGFAAHGVATALLLGLVARQRGAPGQRLLTTMLSTVAHALAEDMVRFAGRPAAPTPDSELLGFGALYRLYAASEGFVFLAVTTEREWRRLVGEAPFAALADDPRFRDEAGRRAHDTELAARLGGIFAARTATDWERALTAVDVACVVSVEGPVEASVTDPDGLARALGLVLEVEHPVLEKHPRLVPALRFSRSRGAAGTGPRIGQHTDAVLRELGYDEARISALRSQGVIGG
jgi:crotonobetainyl-CoA:carnitine CoA-transferase CaiB-like acyl-CoA transferase